MDTRKHAKLAEQWITKHTAINPARARMAVLDTVIWAEAEAELQGKPIAWLFGCCAVKDYASGQWSSRRYAKTGRKGLELVSPEQTRSHCIGRSQRRGDKSPRFWYIVPPAIPKVDQMEIGGEGNT